jgi:glutamate-5-semialdehyde dehydrogenase
MDLNDIGSIGKKAKDAARVLAFIDSQTKNEALLKMSRAILDSEKEILQANEKDVAAAKEKGLRESLINRLKLTSRSVAGISKSLKDVAALPDPVGQGRIFTRPNGLRIQKISVPIGVIAMIYEARPNVTVDAAALCVKAGNACILRGGSEAFNSNVVLCEIIKNAASDLPEGSISLLPWTDRKYALELMKATEYVDVIIPRGGANLIKTVKENATVPVIETGTGVCHAFADAEADIEKALEIVYNSKTNNPGVCNALETLLVHADIAEKFLPKMAERFLAGNVKIIGCEETRKIINWATPATEEDWKTEYLDLIISVKIVKNIDEALEHIYLYGTRHSETIITENYSAAQRFLKEVDSAAVYVNASTRFTDGGRFGFGAEIGISTQKLHARGPMGLSELTSYKYAIYGDGQIV